MDPPARRTLDAGDIGRSDERGQDIPNPIDQIVPNATRIIVFDEAAEAAMLDASNSHVALTYGNTVQHARRWSDLRPRRQLSASGNAMPP